MINEGHFLMCALSMFKINMKFSNLDNVCFFWWWRAWYRAVSRHLICLADGMGAMDKAYRYDEFWFELLQLRRDKERQLGCNNSALRIKCSMFVTIDVSLWQTAHVLLLSWLSTACWCLNHLNLSRTTVFKFIQLCTVYNDICKPCISRMCP